MKSIIRIIFILLGAASIGIAQPVQFNPLNGPEGSYIENFSVNRQGDILADQLHVTEFVNTDGVNRKGIRISRDGGDSWTELIGTFPRNSGFVAHPDGSFYGRGAFSDEFIKLPYGSDSIVRIPIDSLGDSGMNVFAIDENGIFFAMNRKKEIFSSDNEGASWTYLTKGTWTVNAPIRFYTPKSSDYVYIIHNRSGNYQEVIYRFKKDGSAFEFIKNTQYDQIYNIRNIPGSGYVFVNSAGAYFSPDGGTDWTKISSNSGIGAYVYWGVWAGNGDIILVGTNGYFLSNDLGTTWTKVPGKRSSGYSTTLGGQYDPVRNQYYIKNLSSETNNFYRVAPNFSNWTTIAPENNAPPLSKVFVDKNHNIFAGVMLANGSEVEGYHWSTDGGNTFNPLLPDGKEVRSIAEGANGALFAFCYNDSLYRSTNSGLSWTASMPDSISFNPQGDSRLSYVKGDKNGNIIVNFHRAINGKIWLSEDNGLTWELIDTRHYYENNIAFHPDGDIYGSYYENGGGTNLVRYDRQQKTWNNLLNKAISDVFVSPTGFLMIKGSRQWYLSEDNGNSFVTADLGNLLYPTFAQNGYIVALLPSNIGGVPPNIVLSKNNGLSWEVIYTFTGNGYWRDFHFSDDNFVYAAIHGQPIHKSKKLIFEDNFIVGNVFFDKNKTCVFDDDDEYMEDIIVSAEGLDTFYLTTRSDGRFIIPVPAGTYDVKVTVPSPLWEACDSIQTVSLTGINDSTFIDFGIKAIVDCPHLNVDLTNTRMRRCFENEYHVQYCNEGTVTATAALVEITLDSRFTITSSEIPWSGVVGSTYTFPVGDVDIFECRDFSFNVEMVCDSVSLGETICAEARITPDSICLSPNPNWSGASLQVSGECQGDSMIFIIKNVGANDMIQPRQYIVIEDVAIMRVSPPFTLPAGETQRIVLAANGKTVHVEVPQIEGHPGLSAPSATLERCGIGPFQTGFFNQFGQNDLGNTVDIECRVVTGAYDPNDKQAVPTGRDEEHFIQPNSTIEYLIRFQNTGTDTAFNVFVLDTISNLLDITSLEIGAGSHDYEYEIYDNGILRFDFKNIMLPDSNVNQLASNGFIKYKIKLKADAPLGSVIYNAADIYFDFNNPIYTNQTYHTIETPFVTVKTQEVFVEGAAVNVFPNPFSESARFEIRNAGTGSKTFRLFDLSGKQIHSQVFDNEQFTLERKNLNSGFYFYNISAGNMKIVTGKLVVE